MAPLPPPTPNEGPDITLSGRLLLAAMEHNLPKLLLLLAHCTKEDINGPHSMALSSRSLLSLRLPGSALHAACQLANVVMTQLLVWVSLLCSLCPIMALLDWDVYSLTTITLRNQSDLYGVCKLQLQF